MQLSRGTRNLISRGTMLVVGAVLAYWGVACARMTFRLLREGQGGAVLIGAAALVLLLVGGVFLVGALLPAQWLYRLPLGRPPETGKSARGAEHSWWWYLLWW